MYSDVEIDSLINLENAILVCFGDSLEDGLPQVETDDEALIDVLQDARNMTRGEAASYLHGQF